MAATRKELVRSWLISQRVVLDGIGDLLALRGGGGAGEAGLQVVEPGLALGGEGVRRVAALGPLVAGDGLEGLGIAIDAGDAVAVRAVAIDIHVGLNPEDLPRGVPAGWSSSIVSQS